MYDSNTLERPAVKANMLVGIYRVLAKVFTQAFISKTAIGIMLKFFLGIVNTACPIWTYTTYPPLPLLFQGVNAISAAIRDRTKFPITNMKSTAKLVRIALKQCQIIKGKLRNWSKKRKNSSLAVKTMVFCKQVL